MTEILELPEDRLVVPRADFDRMLSKRRGDAFVTGHGPADFVVVAVKVFGL